MLWRGRWTILATTIVVTLAAFIYGKVTGSRWRAESRLFINAGVNAKAGPEVMALGFGATNYAQTQAEVIVSGEILRSALTRFHEEFPDSEINKDETITVPWLKYHLRAEVGSDNDVITLTLDNRHKHEACALVNEVVEAYQKFQRKMQRNSATELYRILDMDRKRYEVEYDAALRALDDYCKKHPAMRLDMQGARASVEEHGRVRKLIHDVDQRLLTARTEAATAAEFVDSPKLMAQLNLGSKETGKPLISPPEELSTPGAEATILAQMEKLGNRRVELLVELQPEHWRVAALDRDIAALKSQLSKMRSVDAENLQNYAATLIAALERRVASIQAERQVLLPLLADAEREVLAVSEHELEYNQLSSRAERTKQTLDNAYAQLQRINIDPDSGKTVAHVLDYAEPNEAKLASGQPIRLPTGILLGLLAGVALAWFQGMLDTRVRTAEELQRRLSVPILASMPQTQAEPKETNAPTATWDNDHEFAEAARTLRTAVYFGLAQLEGKSIQITSAEPGPGKSTIASILAIAMAKAGHRTLLIDADLRKPVQSKRWQASGSGGITSAVAEDLRLIAAVHETEVDGLDLLAAGTPPSNPTEILNSDKFGDLIAQACATYDRVIVDSSPLLPVADARILATKCDATVLAVSGGSTSTKNVSAAYDVLTQVNATVLGIVLNNMPKMKGELAYSYGYGYGGSAKARQPYAFTAAGPEVDVMRQPMSGPSRDSSGADDGHADKRPPAD